MNRKWIYSLTTSCGIHGILFASLSIALTQPVEFGMVEQEGGIEVHMIAAPNQNSKVSEEPHSSVPTEVKEESTPQEIVLQNVDSEPVFEKKPNPVPIQRIKRSPPPLATVSQSSVSSSTGSDPHTVQSVGGSQTDLKPGYLKNPPPVYPEKARRLGQEGLVVLSVKVDEHGNSETVEIKESSGFRLLDEAAVRAVKRWQFRPARIGSLPVSSEVEIPIRFRLN